MNMMKLTVLFVIVFCSFGAYSQDSLKMKAIDEIVKKINTGSFTTEKDTIKNDRPELGLFMTSYLTMVTSDKQMMKYVNLVHIKRTENGVEMQTVGSNIFYFDNSKLIKVEEFMEENKERIDMLWYYADDKPLYYTMKTGKAQERAEFLLKLSKTLLDKVKL